MRDTLLYIAYRAALAVPTIIAVLTLSFILIKLAPGDPAVILAGEAATPEYVENIRRIYALDKPIHIQYITYMQKLLTGDWGYSISFKRPVLEVVLERVPPTLILAGSGVAIGIVGGVFLGIVSAVYRGRAVDRLITVVAFVLYSTPVFVLAQIFIYAFAVSNRLFPIGGYTSIGIDPSDPILYIRDLLWHLALPALSLGLILMAYYVKLTRSSFIEVLASNYITASRAWGLRGRTIIFRHAFRNAILPVVTLAGIQIGLLIGGVVITETIFSWPGIGMLTIEAIQSRDYPLLLGVFTLTALSMVIANLVIDLTYTKIDPRIRLR